MVSDISPTISMRSVVSWVCRHEKKGNSLLAVPAEAGVEEMRWEGRRTLKGGGVQR